MEEHEHAIKDKPEAKPTHDGVAKKAYAIPPTPTNSCPTGA